MAVHFSSVYEESVYGIGQALQGQHKIMFRTTQLPGVN